MQLWGCNSTLIETAVTVVLDAYNLDTGETLSTSFDVILAPNASTEIWQGDVPGQPVRTTLGQVPQPIVVQARLYAAKAETGGPDTLDTRKVLARYSNWPEPWKYLSFPTVDIKISVNGDEVAIEANKPVKGVIFDTDGDECEWSDQAVDLFPGDRQVLSAKGLNGREVSVRYIGDGSA
jgi:beta-mannosidase